MAHFKALREAWERFEADDQAWVAIITGVGESFFAGADLKTYIPEITKFQKEIAEKGLTEVDGYRLDDGTRSVLRNWPLYKPIIAAVNATKESALKGLYVDEDAITQLREAARELRVALEQIDPADATTAQGAIAASVEVLTRLGKELRTAFEKESRISSAIFQTEDAKEGPKAFAEKRPPVW